MNWLAHVLGLDDAAGPFYLFWSGSGGLAVTIVSALLIALRWFNCDERGCWHRGRYQLPDSILVVCRRHWEVGNIARTHQDEPPPEPTGSSSGPEVHKG